MRVTEKIINLLGGGPEEPPPSTFSLRWGPIPVSLRWATKRLPPSRSSFTDVYQEPVVKLLSCVIQALLSGQALERHLQRLY